MLPWLLAVGVNDEQQIKFSKEQGHGRVAYRCCDTDQALVRGLLHAHGGI